MFFFLEEISSLNKELKKTKNAVTALKKSKLKIIGTVLGIAEALLKKSK